MEEGEERCGGSVVAMCGVDRWRAWKPRKMRWIWMACVLRRQGGVRVRGEGSGRLGQCDIAVSAVC